MANYATLKAAIQAVIKQNGNNEITGALLQQSLLSMITSLGANFQFAGIATPATNPGTPDQNVFYIAATAGEYVNFGSIVLNDYEVAVLSYNGVWSKQVTGAVTSKRVGEVDSKLIKIVGMGTISTGTTGVTGVGDVYYNTNDKKLYRCTAFDTPTSFLQEEVAYYNGAIYTYNNDLYVWDGSNLVIRGRSISVDAFRLMIDGEKSNIAQFILNVNAFNGEGDVFAPAYQSHSAARNAVPLDSWLRMPGLVITYLLSDGEWYTEQFCGSDYRLWTNDNLWRPYEQGLFADIADSIDFEISDAQGHCILMLYQGHVITKEFDSRNISDLKLTETEMGDVIITDDSGNVVIQIAGGHIRTKNFNSNKIPSKIATFDGAEMLEGENITLGGATKDIAGIFFDNPGSRYGVKEGDVYFDLHWNKFHQRLSEGGDQLIPSSESEKYGNIRDLIYPHLYYRQFAGNIRPTEGLSRCDFQIKDNMLAEEIVAEYVDGHPSPSPATIYAQYDELVTEFPDYVSRVDIVEELGMIYPEYANLNGQPSGDYEATPSYKTYMYHFCDTTEPYYSINSKDRKYVVLLFSGVHGGERTAVANLQIFMRNLCKNESKDKNLSFLRQNFEFYVIPCVNGYGMYHYQRTNANGVNIERNFNTENWTETPKIVDGNPNPDYSGVTPDSEFETRLIEAVVNLYNPNVSIDHHDYGTGMQAQFFNVAANIMMQRIAYQTLQDVSHALIVNYSDFFGDKFRLFVETSYPVYGDVPKGSFPDWMQYTYRKSQMFGLCEISEYINYMVDANGNAVISGGTNYNDNKVLSIAEYTLRTYLIRMCDYFDKEGWKFNQ